MRLLAVVLMLALTGCAQGRTEPDTASSPRRAVVADTSLRLEVRVPPPLRGYQLDCLTPPDSTGACVLRDQRRAPLQPKP
jgi:hypothetical protein